MQKTELLCQQLAMKLFGCDTRSQQQPQEVCLRALLTARNAQNRRVHTGHITHPNYVERLACGLAEHVCNAPVTGVRWDEADPGWAVSTADALLSGKRSSGT